MYLEVFLVRFIGERLLVKIVQLLQTFAQILQHLRLIRLQIQNPSVLKKKQRNRTWPLSHHKRKKNHLGFLFDFLHLLIQSSYILVQVRAESVDVGVPFADRLINCILNGNYRRRQRLVRRQIFGRHGHVVLLNQIVEFLHDVHV